MYEEGFKKKLNYIFTYYRQIPFFTNKKGYDDEVATEKRKI